MHVYSNLRDDVLVSVRWSEACFFVVVVPLFGIMSEHNIKILLFTSIRIWPDDFYQETGVGGVLWSGRKRSASLRTGHRGYCDAKSDIKRERMS